MQIRGEHSQTDTNQQTHTSVRHGESAISKQVHLLRYSWPPGTPCSVKVEPASSSLKMIVV